MDGLDFGGLLSAPFKVSSSEPPPPSSHPRDFLSAHPTTPPSATGETMTDVASSSFVHSISSGGAKLTSDASSAEAARKSYEEE